MDSQEHKSYRAAVERYTNGKAVNAAEDAVDKAIRADWADFANNGGTNMAPLCYYTQGSVAVAFYGLEGEEEEWLRDICRGLVSSRLSPTASGEYTTDDRMTKLLALVEDILADRRENPRDDIFFTALVEDEDDGCAVSANERIDHGFQILGPSR